MVEAALAAVRPTADAKGVMLEYEMAADSDEISGDADRLQPIVWNLLANAIKFTPRDVFRSTVRVERHDKEVDAHRARYRPGNFSGFPGARLRQIQPGRQRQHSRARRLGSRGSRLCVIWSNCMRALWKLRAMARVGATLHGPDCQSNNPRQHPPATIKLRPWHNQESSKAFRYLVIDDEPDSAKCWPSSCGNMARRLVPLRPPRKRSPRLPTARRRSCSATSACHASTATNLSAEFAQLIPETDMLAMALTGLGSAQDRKRAPWPKDSRFAWVKPVEPEHLVEAIKQLLPSRQRSTR